ncbi:PD-(D/E)XK nuclease family protein [uncultured Lacinutrix sp.]|uniref:PD-(D/E)XK nuclease family protein n=1 Tax=uncultured Lacinutrix sp. TaxID=574032 RepID=UPI00262AE22C|nr:PD-(D/E)XK nuclease family protein [uncultured Lacinutrix sp.]
MIIKETGQNHSILNRFSLLGKNEVALSKGFAFVLGSEREAMFSFLKHLGIKLKNTENNFSKIKVEIERKRDRNRTDIEISYPNRFHIIIECKVRKGKVTEQRTQYIRDFNPECPQNILCFITQERDSTKQKVENVEVTYLGWLEIIDLYTSRKHLAILLIKEFSQFALRTYNMNEQKEILIQDVSDPTEMDRYKNYKVYRRFETFGIPLYFAPHFTRKAKQEEGEGISYLSKVLGTLTMKPHEITNTSTELSKFSKDQELIKLWIRGVKLDKDNKVYTYYFMDEPVKLNKPLRKDPGIKKGRGKNWIAASVPPNRCVSFKEFTRRIMLQE